MKKTTLIYECDNKNHNGTLKMEGSLADLTAVAGKILMEISKAAAKALDEEPADIAIRIAGASIDMLMDEKKGEDNE